MIEKMNPLIASEKLLRWTGKENIYEFLNGLLEDINLLKEYDGLVEDDTFMARLPFCVRQKYQDVIKKEEDMNINVDIQIEKDLEKDLVPKNSNLAKKQRKQRAKKKVDPEKSPAPQKASKVSYSKEINPFKDSQQFVYYYKAFLQQCSGTTSIRFDNFSSDVEVAGSVLDLLHDSNRKTREFLDTWLEYFFEHNLKGNKMYQVKNTSIRTFRYTFERFNETFYIPQ